MIAPSASVLPAKDAIHARQDYFAHLVDDRGAHWRRRRDLPSASPLAAGAWRVLQ